MVNTAGPGAAAPKSVLCRVDPALTAGYPEGEDLTLSSDKEGSAEDESGTVSE